MAVAGMDYEPAGELKIGQVGIANLRVRTLDVPQLAAEMRERVARAPKLFERAAVVLDFGGLAQTPDAATARGRRVRAGFQAAMQEELTRVLGRWNDEDLATLADIFPRFVRELRQSR